MESRSSPALSRRERQVMDALYRLGKATVSELREAMPQRASYAAVRAALRSLREKGQVDYREKGPRYVYSPSLSPRKARSRALDHLVRTFFGGSPEAAAVALLEMADLRLPEQEVRRLEERVKRAREEGR